MLITIVLVGVLLAFPALGRQSKFLQKRLADWRAQTQGLSGAQQLADVLKRCFITAAGFAFVVAVAAVALSAAIVWGGPDPVPAMPSINDPFKRVDFSRLPAAQTYAGLDGALLAYRVYDSGVRGSAVQDVVLIHGSSADSRSMHPLAQALASTGRRVFSLDIRGHGASAAGLGKGHIAYVGQLEDDLLAFVRHIGAPQQNAGVRPILLGFSAGGGFALRVAGSQRFAPVFERFVLLAPFISQNAPTYRPNSGGWVSVGLPRIVALSVLNGLGITQWNHLTVSRFALNDSAKNELTQTYDFNLAMNFRPVADYRANIVAASPARMDVLVGALDEAFVASAFAGVFARDDNNAKVTVVPQLQHISLILDPSAFQHIAAALQTP